MEYLSNIQWQNKFVQFKEQLGRHALIVATSKGALVSTHGFQSIRTGVVKVSSVRSALSTLRAQTFWLLDWALAPRTVAKLLLRHGLGLGLLWSCFVFWKLVFLPALRRAAKAACTVFVRSPPLRHQLRARLEEAQDYEVWRQAADELDRLTGLNVWKDNPHSPHYDFRRLRSDLLKLRQLVDDRDVAGIMRFSRSRLVRNIAGITDPRLHAVMRAGTKRLIEEYISEVVHALQCCCVLETPQITLAEKLAFFNETRHAFGRSALLLSGGATLGLYHTGVVKALNDNNLLPRVLSGASVGSIITSIVGTRTDAELRTVFEPGSIELNFFPTNEGSVRRKLGRLLTQGVLLDIRILEACVRANIPDLTFAEAYSYSGRIINIVVSPAQATGNLESSRLLNYLTAPNVLVWSAALASCAIPGVYAPVELMAKDEHGRIVPYIEGNAVKWEDGSMSADLPMQRLSELFNVNHFIVSQVNPHVLPFILTKTGSGQHGVMHRLIEFLGTEISSQILALARLGVLPLPRFVRALMDQAYRGDITIVPHASLSDYQLLLVNPTEARLQACLTVSERATWEHLAMVRSSCEIEFTLDECVRRTRGTMIMAELSEQRRMSSVSRVRSWATDAFNAARLAPHPQAHAHAHAQDHVEAQSRGVRSADSRGGKGQGRGRAHTRDERMLRNLSLSGLAIVGDQRQGARTRAYSRSEYAGDSSLRAVRSMVFTGSGSDRTKQERQEDLSESKRAADGEADADADEETRLRIAAAIALTQPGYADHGPDDSDSDSGDQDRVSGEHYHDDSSSPDLADNGQQLVVRSLTPLGVDLPLPADSELTQRGSTRALSALGSGSCPSSPQGACPVSDSSTGSASASGRRSLMGTPSTSVRVLVDSATDPLAQLHTRVRTASSSFGLGAGGAGAGLGLASRGSSGTNMGLLPATDSVASPLPSVSSGPSSPSGIIMPRFRRLGPRFGVATPQPEPQQDAQ